MSVYKKNSNINAISIYGLAETVPYNYEKGKLNTNCYIRTSILEEKSSTIL